MTHSLRLTSPSQTKPDRVAQTVEPTRVALLLMFQIVSDSK